MLTMANKKLTSFQEISNAAKESRRKTRDWLWKKRRECDEEAMRYVGSLINDLERSCSKLEKPERLIRLEYSEIERLFDPKDQSSEFVSDHITQLLSFNKISPLEAKKMHYQILAGPSMLTLNFRTYKIIKILMLFHDYLEGKLGKKNKKMLREKAASIRKVPDVDFRISCAVSPEIIRSYFNTLTSSDTPKSKPILTAKQVSHFLHANFKGFDPKVPKRYFHANTKKIYLKYFIYQFYIRCSNSRHEASDYRNLLVENFENFKSDKVNILLKKFSVEPKKFPAWLRTLPPKKSS